MRMFAPLLPLACMVAALVLTPRVADAIYAGTDVVELTDTDFKQKVLDDEHVWMVEFYAPWCGHCQKLKPDYVKAAASTKGLVRFGAMDCDTYKTTMWQYGVKGFPTLKIFGKNKKKAEDYNGERSAKAMADALVSRIPNYVNVTAASNFDEIMLGDNLEKPRALLFTAKSVTSPLYKALALDLKGRMVLAEVRAKTQKALVERFQLEDSKLPVLLVWEKGVKPLDEEKQPVKYEGAVEHKPVLEFLKRFALPKVVAAEPSKAPPAPLVKVLEEPSAVDEQCGKGTGFCVVMVAQSDDKEALSSFESLSQSYRNDPFKFFRLSDSPSLEAASALSSSSKPLLSILQRKRAKLAFHSGLEGVEGVLDRALGGDLSYQHVIEGSWLNTLQAAAAKAGTASE